MLADVGFKLDFVHFEAMLGHAGAKMANKRDKMGTKSAKMNQDGRTWAAKANEIW